MPTLTTEAQELKALLDKASVAYAKGSPIMTDGEFDAKTAEYFTLTEEKYFWQDETGDIEHSRPMLSLEKAKTVAEIPKFFKRENGAAVLLPKIDGLACTLTYVSDATPRHRLTQALTRGKRVGGITYGNTVTNNVRQIQGVPQVLVDNGGATMEVRGEIYMPEAFFGAANEMRVAAGKSPFENVRNAAAGILRNESGEGLQFLRFVAYNAFQPGVAAHDDLKFDTYLEVLNWLGCNKFEVPHAHVIDLSQITLETLHGFIDNEPWPFQTDGAVVVLNEMAMHRSLGSNRSHPLHSIAFKFEDETAETELEKIVWAATRTGRVMPTYVFKEVRLEGTTVTRATGHNLANLEKIGAVPGDIVEVYKANMIIPQVKRVVKKVVQSDTALRLHIPHICPDCGGPTTCNEVDLLCENGQCPAKMINTLVNAANRKNWDIDILGDAIAEALVERGHIRDLSDLFKLTVAGIQWLELGEKGIRLGQSRAEKLIEQIEKAKSKPWAVTLHALGCPGLGEPECKAIAAKYSLYDLRLVCAHEDAPEAFVAELVKIKGMGKKTAETLVNWIISNMDMLAELDGIGLNTEAQPEAEQASTILDGKTFVITGTHSVPRHVLEKLVTDNGGVLSGSVSKKTDYLVAGEAAGSKLDKANEVNAKAKTDADKVAIIDEAGLRALLT